MTRPDRSTFRYAAAGVLATLAGMATGHLVASLLNPAASPVLAVGSTVIDLTPTPVKEYAVREFGNADKPLLIAGVMLVTLVVAGLAGVLARRRLALGTALLLLLVSLAGVLALRRPAAEIVDVVPAMVAALAGVGTLWALTRRRPTRGAAAVGQAAAAGTSRRTVLVATGVVAAATVMAGAGQWIGKVRTRIGEITLPAAADPAPPLPRGLESKVDGISSFRTPNSRFYRVDTNLTVPVVDVDDWSLTIDGDVENALIFSFADLMAMKLIERDITLTCVSNEVGGKYVGAARWLGVPLRDLLDRAGVGSGADQILSTAVDGFTISTPLDVALDGRDAMIAIGMNGDPLPRDHGFPARLVTPGIYGFVGATKWLERLTLTTYAEETAYWTDRDWATDAPIKISSRVDTPKPLSTIDPGRTVIGGVAWAQTRGIATVEVRIDGGEWQEARLGPDAGVDYWRQWYLPWTAEPGRRLIAVRATDGDGVQQSVDRASPFPEGSSGIQEIVISVS